MKNTEYIPYFILVSLILIDTIMLLGVVNIFFDMDPTIIAGIIAFIGAVIGGAITYIGVRRTLYHRDREIFMTNLTERLMIIDSLINKYKNPINSIGVVDLLNKKIDYTNILEIAKHFYSELNEDNEKIYKCLEYDSIRIIDFHKKTLYSLMIKEKLTEDEQHRLIGKLRDIFNVFLVSKKLMDDKYYNYKRMSS